MKSAFQEKLLRFVPKIIRHDFGRKVIALTLTALIYFAVTEQTGQSKTVDDVEVKLALPENLVDIGGKIPHASVTVTGPERLLKSLSRGDFSIVLPFDATFTPGRTTYQIPLYPGNVKSPFGVSVVKVEPSVMSFEVDRIVSKPLPMEPVYSPDSALPEGYTVGKVTFAQPVVSVTAPETMLSNLKAIQTDVIPLDKTTQSFSYTVGLKSPNPSITLTPAKVMVNVEILKEFETRTFKDVPIRILNATGRQELTVDILSDSDVDVIVEGNRSVLELLEPENLKPYIDVSRIEKSGIYNMNVNCWVDRDDVRIKTIHPDLLSVKLIFDPSSSPEPSPEPSQKSSSGKEKK